MSVNQKIAQYLGENVGKNTIASLVYRKNGQKRGRGEDRQVYGDDLVSVVLITGVDYMNVVQKSQDMLVNVRPNEIVREAERASLRDKEGQLPVHADVQQALMELWGSFDRTLNGESRAVQDVYEPLSVEGTPVPGCKVYNGDNEAEDAPEKGTIYLQGLKVGEKVIEPAIHGPCPPAQSSAKTIAKRLIRKRLPVSRYVSYSLKPGSGFDLRVGTSAGLSADKDGVIIRDDELQHITHLL